MAESDDVERATRERLRALRRSLGWSLGELAERSHLSPSVISRIETGKRTISLDVLLSLARAMQVDLDVLLDVHRDDEDIVIRPVPTRWSGTTTWPLSRPTSSTVAVKMRFEPRATAPEPRVHAGYDWLFVLTGRIELTLGDRQIVVDAGEAAEFSTMTPHAVRAVDDPAEIIMVLDRDGHRAHVHREGDGGE